MRKDRQVRNHRSVTFSHSIRGASSTDVIPPANHLPSFLSSAAGLFRLPNHEIRIACFGNSEGHPCLGMSTLRDTVGDAGRALL